MRQSIGITRVTCWALFVAGVAACSGGGDTATDSADAAASAGGTAAASASGTAGGTAAGGTAAGGTAGASGMIDSTGATNTTNDYNRLYVATKETQWSTNPAGPNPTTGTIAAGDTVYFNREPNQQASWQDARVKKLNERRFVRPADYRQP